MNTDQSILSANAEGALLSEIASGSYGDHDSLANRLAKLHNSGTLDILDVFQSDQLDTVSGSPFFKLQQVFCLTLPQIQCTVENTVATYKALFEKAGEDLEAGEVYRCLCEWFQVRRGRVDAGLALIQNDLDIPIGVIRSILLAGAAHNLTEFVTAALELSHQNQSHIRQGALSALGQMPYGDDDDNLARVIERFDQVIESPMCEHDAVSAINAAFQLLKQPREKFPGAIEPLLIKFCKNPMPNRFVIANNLLRHRKIYTEAMIDASFSALQRTGKDESGTITQIDSILYEWDLDEDRQRVFRFVSGLLGSGDHAINIEALDCFRNRLTNEPGGVLGWYVVSLFLSGDHNLCVVANELLPINRTQDGLDIDLISFSLTSPWVLYLARKILGYCLFKKEAAAALLLSCLRVIPEQERYELEEHVLNHFLMNYPGAVDWFEPAISVDDPAKESVDRLSSKVKAYIAELKQLGQCLAFNPSERERQIQGYHQADFGREINKQVEKKSIFSGIIHKAAILYGTGSIFYVYGEEGSEPHRQEISMGYHEFSFEAPRLSVIDPIGLQFAIYRFQSELPPS